MSAEHNDAAAADKAQGRGGNGSLPPHGTTIAAAADEPRRLDPAVLVFAAELPNIDGRENVAFSMSDFVVEDGEVGAGETPVTLAVKFGRPNDQEWFRIHPDPARALRVWTIRDKNSMGRTYIIAKRLLPLVGDKAKQCLLRQAVTTRHKHYVWPVPVVGETSMPSDLALHEAASQAVRGWRRVEWNKKCAEFDARKPDDDLGAPAWPTESFDEVVALGVKGSFIADDTHEFIREVINGRR